MWIHLLRIDNWGLELQIKIVVYCYVFSCLLSTETQLRHAAVDWLMMSWCCTYTVDYSFWVQYQYTWVPNSCTYTRTEEKKVSMHQCTITLAPFMLLASNHFRSLWNDLGAIWETACNLGWSYRCKLFSKANDRFPSSLNPLSFLQTQQDLLSLFSLLVCYIIITTPMLSTG